MTRAFGFDRSARRDQRFVGVIERIELRSQAGNEPVAVPVDADFVNTMRQCFQAQLFRVGARRGEAGEVLFSTTRGAIVSRPGDCLQLRGSESEDKRRRRTRRRRRCGSRQDHRRRRFTGRKDGPRPRRRHRRRNMGCHLRPSFERHGVCRRMRRRRRSGEEGDVHHLRRHRRRGQVRPQHHDEQSQVDKRHAPPAWPCAWPGVLRRAALAG